MSAIGTPLIIWIQAMILGTGLMSGLRCYMKGQPLHGIFRLAFAWMLSDSLGLLTWAAFYAGE